jgi:hypothetical protein
MNNNLPNRNKSEKYLEKWQNCIEKEYRFKSLVGIYNNMEVKIFLFNISILFNIII